MTGVSSTKQPDTVLIMKETVHWWIERSNNPGHIGTGISLDCVTDMTLMTYLWNDKFHSQKYSVGRPDCPAVTCNTGTSFHGQTRKEAWSSGGQWEGWALCGRRAHSQEGPIRPVQVGGVRWAQLHTQIQYANWATDTAVNLVWGPAGVAHRHG